LKKFMIIVAAVLPFMIKLQASDAENSADGKNAVPVSMIDPGQVENNSILASVNGQAITLVDVLQLTQIKELQARSVYSGERLFKEIADYRKKAVNDLIDNMLIQTEFGKHNFTLSTQDIEREIDELASRVGCYSRSQLERRLHQEGSSMEVVRMTIRKNLMVQLMLYRQIRIADPVTPKELHEYYLSNESSFSVPDRIILAMLKLDSATGEKDKIIQEISSILKAEPERFTELVKKYSPALGNGELGEIDRKLLRPEFASAFKEFVPGMVVGPLNVYDGVVWLKVVSYQPAGEVKFADVEQKIKLELEQKKREKVFADYAAKLRSGALIEYYF